MKTVQLKKPAAIKKLLSIVYIYRILNIILMMIMKLSYIKIFK